MEPTTDGRRSIFKSSGPAWIAQGAKVRWVDHSGMYADAMTKKNGNVPLLQMLLRTGRICITEESITLEKTQVKSLVTKQFIQDSY